MCLIDSSTFIIGNINARVRNIYVCASLCLSLSVSLFLSLSLSPSLSVSLSLIFLIEGWLKKIKNLFLFSSSLFVAASSHLKSI